jgi:hypothetical protein
MTTYRVKSYLRMYEGLCVTFFCCHWHRLWTDGYCYWFHPLLAPLRLGGTRRNDMSPLQISSVLLSRTLLLVWPVWTTSLEHPLLGCNWRLFCHGFLNNFRFAIEYSICSIPPLCGRSFCMTGVTCVLYEFWVKITSSDSCLSQCSWSGMRTTATLGFHITLFVEKR